MDGQVSHNAFHLGQLCARGNKFSGEHFQKWGCCCQKPENPPFFPIFCKVEAGFRERWSLRTLNSEAPVDTERRIPHARLENLAVSSRPGTSVCSLLAWRLTQRLTQRRPEESGSPAFPTLTLPSSPFGSISHLLQTKAKRGATQTGPPTVSGGF